MGSRDYRRIPENNDRLGRIETCGRKKIVTEYVVSLTTNLCNSVFHSFLVLHVTFVSDKKLVDPFGGISVDFLQPLLDIVERVHVGHIINNADAMSTPVIGGSYCSKPLLSSSIPLKINVESQQAELPS